MTTLRGHIKSQHQVCSCQETDIHLITILLQSVYDTWCKKEGFQLKLPKVVQAKKEAVLAQNCAKQQSLDPHLVERTKVEYIPSYTDDLMQEVAIEWLITTDQVSLLLFDYCLSELIVHRNGSRFKLSSTSLSKKCSTSLHERLKVSKSQLVKPHEMPSFEHSTKISSLFVQNFRSADIYLTICNA